jgi:hypothetical protein
MGRWLRRVGELAKKAGSEALDAAQDQLTTASLSANGADLGRFGGRCVEQLSEAAARCGALAAETVKVCGDTAGQRDAVLAFGEEIRDTLARLGEGGALASAGTLETIRELTSGERVAAAAELAETLEASAAACVEKSVEMTTVMEEGLDSLPAPLQTLMDQVIVGEGGGGGDEEEDDEEDAIELVKNLDRDIEDVRQCIDAIQNLHLATALQVGLEAFEQLSHKANRSRSMFDSIRDYAQQVADLSEAVQDGNVVAAGSKIKDVWQCIQLSSVMKQLAEGAGMLMKVLIGLFKVIAEKISTLWGALALAKECMSDCVAHVNEARALCLDARDRSVALLERTTAVRDQLKDIGELSVKSVTAVRDLSDGQEIRDAVDLARSMDDLVLQCSAKVVAMVDRVDEGFRAMPDILTDGIDVAEEGKEDDDPEPANVEEDIVELEKARESIENADMIRAVSEGVNGFSGVSGKVGVCRELLELVEGFAQGCLQTIESFLGVWDLESAAVKIKEMCRMVNLGEMMKLAAQQIKRLLQAMIALMMAASEKLKTVDLPGSVGEAVDAAVDMAKDKLSDLKFWKPHR